MRYKELIKEFYLDDESLTGFIDDKVCFEYCPNRTEDKGCKFEECKMTNEEILELFFKNFE